MQRPGEPDSLPSTSIRRWHPTLTPYRLLVLGTTIGVGTAKAVAAQEGGVNVSTTLEWIFGVVIFLILYSLSTYDETPKDSPHCLDWMFTVDCMDGVWRLLSLAHIPRPSYSSELELTRHSGVDVHNNNKSNATHLTLYRLFVCLSTAAFGLTKAAMTYFGYSVGANWVDWTLGAVMTSLIFILGMYENNAVGMWHAFFVPDCTVATGHVLSLSYITFGHLGWIWLCFQVIYLTWNDPDNGDNFSNKNVQAPLVVLRGYLINISISLWIALIIVMSALLSVLSVAVLSVDSRSPWWVGTGEWVLKQRPAWKDGYIGLEPQGRQLSRRIAYHTVSLTVFLLGCAIFLALWIVCVAVNVEEGYIFLDVISDSNLEPPLDQVILAISILFQLTCAIVTAYLMWLVTWRILLPPLWKWKNAETGWENALLF